MELHHSHSDVSAMVLLFFGPDPKKKKENWVTKAAKLSVKRLALQYLKIPLILENILLALNFTKKLPKMPCLFKNKLKYFFKNAVKFILFKTALIGLNVHHFHGL